MSFTVSLTPPLKRCYHCRMTTHGNTYFAVPMDREFDYDPESAIDFDELESYWSRIAGAYYYQDAYCAIGKEALTRKGQIFRLSLQAVAEPDNEYDPCAVMLTLNGMKCGYVPAHVSPRIYSFVMYQYAQGNSCFLPGAFCIDDDSDSDSDDLDFCESYSDIDEYECFIEEDQSHFHNYHFNVWVALPTAQTIENHLDQDLINEQMFRIWRKAPDEIKRQLREFGFHFRTLELYNYFKSEAGSRTVIPFEGPADGESSVAVDRALMYIRKLFFAQQMQIKYERNARIIEAVSQGRTFKSVAEEFGVSASTVSKIAKDAGVHHTATACVNERYDNYLTRCIEMVILRNEGLSLKDIASRFKVSYKTVEKMLADGRFYRDPSCNPRRLALVTLVLENRENEMLQMSSYIRNRARRDAIILQRKNESST